MVHRFYWKNVIYKFGLPKVIITDTGTQFASAPVVNFCKDLGIQNMFTLVEHPHANRQGEAANKVFLVGLKKNLDETKGLWAEYLHEILWSYHTTPHSTIQETLFRLVYGTHTMIPHEINTPTWRRKHFEESINTKGLDTSDNLVKEIQKESYIREFVAKD